MDLSDLIGEITGDAPHALDEHRSKQILKTVDIPIVTERVTSNESEAVAAAADFGYPVVLKGLGSRLAHKTEMGLVHVKLESETAVRVACEQIRRRAADDLEGILVQPYVAGSRELVAGLFHDAQFGAVVMFGLGGTLAEALNDVVFRLAPLNESDTDQMMDEIRSRSLLDSFRGEAAVNRRQIRRILMGLSRLAQTDPRIREIDINPLRVGPDGEVCAVDALVVVGTAPPPELHPAPVDPRALGAIFYPRSIAFVGASAEIGKWGHLLFTNTVSGGFKGNVYLVNPKGGLIAGREVYKTVDAIPDPVALAVVTIPAGKVIDLIPQLKAKGIKQVLMITSGFGETDEAGKQLEAQVVSLAREAGILIVGPNTMGILSPSNRFFCTGSHIRPRPGSTVVLAQSGNMGTQLLAFAEQQGIGIRGYCGSGNEAMISVEDYLDAFEVDDKTRIVTLYIESVKNGRRFYDSARRLGRKKPIVLLKGGRSRAGNRAAASHTGALAADTRVFDAVCRQAGIVQVDQPMDLLDLAAAFSSLPLPRGGRAAIMTLGGGWGVVTADLCARHNLSVPELPPELVDKFDRILPAYWSRANPVDIVGERDPALPLTVMEELVKWDGCDAVINLGILGRRLFVNRLLDSIRTADPNYAPEFLDDVKQMQFEFEQTYVRRIIDLTERYNKPIYGVSLLDEDNKTVYRCEDRCYKAVFYPSPERAVRALAKMREYQRCLTCD